MRRALTGCLAAAILAGGTVALVTTSGTAMAGQSVSLRAAALSGSDPTFDQITWGQSSLSASGTTMTLQTLSVHVVDPRQYPSSCWEFWEQRTGGTGTFTTNWSAATLASGTDADGIWTTSFYLPSTADGTWSLATAVECSDAGARPTFQISSAPTFTVTGHHQPRISWGYVPKPVPLANPYVTIKGRITDADTGAGLPGLTIGRAEDTYCLNGIGDGSTRLEHLATTNSNGYFAIASSRDNPMYLQCLGVYGTPRNNPDGFAVFVWFAETWFHYVPGVSAAPASSQVPHGTLDQVNGAVIGTTHCPIDLQRLHGATAWRRVNTGYVRTSGRFTLTAQPPSVGRFIYRGYYPARCLTGPQLQDAASSKPFTITGT